MSPVRRLPPTESSEGTGISSIRPIEALSNLITSARTYVQAAFQSSSSANMPKPMNVDATRPMNTLSNNTSSRSPYGLLPKPPSTPPSPPAKRRRLDQTSPNPPHTSARFAVTDPVPPRKRSKSVVSIPESPRSAASNISASQPSVASNMSSSQLSGVVEYRSLSFRSEKRQSKGRWRPARTKTTPTKHKDASNPRSELNSSPKDDDDITDDDVDLVCFSNPHRPKPENAQQRSVSEYVDQYRPSNRPSKPAPTQDFREVIEEVENRNLESRKKKFGQSDLSPDELASGTGEVSEGRPAKRLKVSSFSLSKRGDIVSTNFTANQSPAPPPKECQQPARNKTNASTIIGNGLSVLRGASGQGKYQAGRDNNPESLFLSILDGDHTLHPVDKENHHLLPYKYLTLNLQRVTHIRRTTNVDDNYKVIVLMNGANIADGAGPLLVIEFASKPGYSRFFQWVADYSKTKEVVIKDCKRHKLEQDFDNVFQRAKFNSLSTDADKYAPVADDISVMMKNHSSPDSKARPNSGAADETITRSKVRDTMNYTPTARSGGFGVPSSLSRSDRPFSAAREPRTRSTFACIDSPEPAEPDPEGWTSLNPGWGKQWRNSLVYPDTGKNRATVDKDDIQRLDEGQFLNDNLIIFYLRYLQKTLEDTNKDLAQRVYFQNTFFYDKLKPAKSGQAINYESIKTWTSKVDLFSKDFIIVPINEYTHWYVAIICNAPALLPSSVYQKQTSNNSTDKIAMANDVRVSRAPSEGCSRIELLSGSIGENVVENMRRLSIDKSDTPGDETNKDMETKPEPEIDADHHANGHNVYVVSDLATPRAKSEQVASETSPPSRKKMGKRPSIGLPKHDPHQPRIITLDSLGVPHSPTCSYLKQYLIAELQDKKGVSMQAPRAMGCTARNIPEQTNHCDCGLFLLGYIQQFLDDPDEFMKGLLQKNCRIPWRLDPSALRNNIRDVILNLQKEQQARENLAQERKRLAKVSKSRAKIGEPLRYTASSTTIGPATPLKLKPSSQNHSGGKTHNDKSPSALPSPPPPGSKGSSVLVGEKRDPLISSNALTNLHWPVSSGYKDGSRDRQRRNTTDLSSAREAQVKLRSDARMVGGSPRAIDQASEYEFHHHKTSGASSSSPVRGSAILGHSLSPVADSTIIQQNLVPPLPETPSSRGARGATPRDPVVVDDSDNEKRRQWRKSSQNDGHGQQANRLVVELSSMKSLSPANNQSPVQGCKTDERKQTGHQSSYFLNRRQGEQVTSAKLRSKSEDVIDIADD